ncbi:MAG: DUF2911 domain-containing protein [Bacteroidota bacterium]
MKSLTTLVLLICLLNAEAQNLKVPTLSPFSEIKQEVGLTEIQLSYARPSAKGRAVFGGLVPFGEIWRTGANASTKLTVSEEVIIAGNALPAGTYALYTIPGPAEWTVIVHKKTDMRSVAGGKVKPENDAFRFTVKPGRNPLYVETFTIQFTDIKTKSLQVQLSWENTVVKFPVEVEVDAKIDSQMAVLLQEPDKMKHRNYFKAAEYYLHNGKDLDQAMDWINTALEKSENNYRYGLLQAKIFQAQGNEAMAISTVKTAHEWARAANNSNYMEQTRTYLASLETGKPGGGNTPEQYADDVSSLDNIMSALYASISGDKGVKRDWHRFRNLFVEEARLMPTGKRDGKTGYRIMTPDGYAEGSGKWLEENGFHEVEINRETEEYGSLVHVWSTYESYRSKADEKPFMRGINSIQLMNDGERWWIMHIYWLGEKEELPLPAHYLPKG